MLQPTTDRCASFEAGFTLIEVLCSVTIAAFSIVSLYSGLATSLSATDRLDRHLGARIVAESVLAEVASGPRGMPQSKRGTAGQYNWQLDVIPAAAALGRIRPEGLALYDLTLVVAWAPRGHLEIKTIRLGASP
jgi:prepilin-type N-terminal cleavage/methylation domain-containing protein